MGEGRLLAPTLGASPAFGMLIPRYLDLSEQFSETLKSWG